MSCGSRMDSVLDRPDCASSVAAGTGYPGAPCPKLGGVDTPVRTLSRLRRNRIFHSARVAHRLPQGLKHGSRQLRTVYPPFMSISHRPRNYNLSHARCGSRQSPPRRSMIPEPPFASVTSSRKGPTQSSYPRTVQHLRLEASPRGGSWPKLAEKAPSRQKMFGILRLEALGWYLLAALGSPSVQPKQELP